MTTDLQRPGHGRADTRPPPELPNTSPVGGQWPARTSPGRARSRRHGVTTLEFALAFPVFLFLVFGLIEFSRAMMVVSLLNNAARTGCREAILPTATPASVETLVSTTLSRQGVNGFSTTVLVNNQPVALTSAGKNDLMTVRVTVPPSRVSWIPGLNLIPGTLQGQYTLPRE